MFKRFKQDGGFSLVELMTVLLIIGILTTIALPRFTAVLRMAKVKACDANVRIVNSAITTWMMDSPLNVPANAITDLATLEDTLVPKFLDRIPTCPFGAENVYIVNGGFVSVHDHSAD